MASTQTVVPVRLSCRYSNGMVMSFGARALSYKSATLRILTRENFEVGIPLTAMSSLLSGATTCRVAKVARSKDQPGFFEVELRTAASARPELKPASAPAVPEVLRAAARVLAGLLAQSAPQATLNEALDGMSPALASTCVLAAGVAVLALVGRRGLADPWPLLRSLEATP